MMKKAKEEFAVCLSVTFALIVPGCMPNVTNGKDDDTEYIDCTDVFCQEWCEGNFCRNDVGLSQWGACFGECSDLDGCECQDIGCFGANCDDYCVVAENALKGRCNKDECLCLFEPDAGPDSGADAGRDSGK